MARIWTRLHEYLGVPPGRLTFDMVRRATAGKLAETDDLDWKQVLPRTPENGQWNELAKDVAAMANTRGGLIIYGVTDTIDLVGIDPEAVAIQQYEQWIRNHVQPYLPDLEIYPLTDDSTSTSDGARTVLVVDVPASEMAPHFVYGTAQRDKEQMAAVVPYRASDQTAWMPEHQIERAYRDRFARIGRAEEELQHHLELTVQHIAAQTEVPSAWFVAAARPQRPLPRSVRTLDRNDACEVLRKALDRAAAMFPGSAPTDGVLSGMSADVRENPRPGLRRWVCSTLERDRGPEFITELHDDGVVVMAGNVSWVRGRDDLPARGADLTVPEWLVMACCRDFVATVQELQRALRLDSAQQLTASIVAPHGPRALAPTTYDSTFHREGTPPYARRPHTVQAVHTVLSPASEDQEGQTRVTELHTDLMNQFGLAGLG
ncbi:ATP-binding protein [Streptomyces armeniacus]|uniref:ATP-binding protein n=1 Tax=Streptomyces armeniacus TaxID=83291 RepID=A0A345XY61_9ACTN|nr:ATP-binding protein [Streptomyces armeniacus]AXK36577.1 ATP-binding protein [Streptomyces armeniacus]